MIGRRIRSPASCRPMMRPVGARAISVSPIWPVPGWRTATMIENQASIVFDVNEPIITNVAVNTIDTTAPDARDRRR